MAWRFKGLWLERSEELRYAIRFTLLAALLFGVYYFPYTAHGISEAFFERYLSAYAWMAGKLLSVFDDQVSVAGTIIHGRFPMRIVHNCDAVEAKILFVSAALARPGPLLRRALAALGGTALITSANLLRIISLYHVGVLAPGLFEFAHLELWPLLLIAFCVLQLWLWARFVRPAPKPGLAVS
jgi:exosortase/archaeosortase family protein